MTDVVSLLNERVGAPRDLQGLGTVRAAASVLGDPQEQVPVIHLAGTSGKTSTAYALRSLLQDAGLRTGLTVSPHINCINERIQIDGQPLEDSEFLNQFGKIFERLGPGLGGMSYFEVLILLAYSCFADRKVDVAIVETGLGGRLDATNIIGSSRKTCVITDIGLDHTEILGDTIAEIAREKAGIIFPGNHVLMHTQDDSIVNEVTERCTAVGAELTLLPAIAGSVPDVMERNIALGQVAADYFLRSVLGRVGFELRPGVCTLPPGRTELIQLRDDLILLDGAHNPQKLRALGDWLNRRDIRTTSMLCNMISAPEHKLEQSARVLSSFAARLIIPPFGGAQDVFKPGLPAISFADITRRCGVSEVQTTSDLRTAIDLLISHGDALPVVTGSLYLVAQARRELIARGGRPMSRGYAIGRDRQVTLAM